MKGLTGTDYRSEISSFLHSDPIRSSVTDALLKATDPVFYAEKVGEGFRSIGGSQIKSTLEPWNDQYP